MKPYTKTRGGVYTRTRTTRIKTTGAVSQTKQTFFTTKESDELSGVTSMNGDHKTPLNQSYKTIKNAYISGRVVSASEDGIATYVLEDEGDLGLGTQTYGFDPSTDAYNQCVSRLNSKVRSSLDLSVSIAQAGQVVKAIQGIQDIVHYVRKFPSHALRSMYKDWKNNPKKVGSAWLEFQYGWKPLAQDVYDTVNQVLDGRINLTKVRERAHVDRTQSFTTVTSGVRTTDSVRFSTWVEIGIQLDLTPGVLGRLSNYTSLNPASLVWELTPFSFVVDWVYDVGGYIRETETAMLNSGRYVSGYTTITSQVSNSRVSNGGYNTSPNVWGSTSTSGTFKSTVKSRVAMGGYPFPKLPRFNANLGSGRLLNAAALLSQHLSR